MNTTQGVGQVEGTFSIPMASAASMREVLAAAEDVADTATTVLLTGESGTGKEVLSRYIHRLSKRCRGPWVAVDCTALPAELLESELFGHERGAFAGSSERQIGRIEQANGGTLLLDEISALPIGLQAKLFRVLQERAVDRGGDSRSVPVDVRIVATSNRDLPEMVRERNFRADLYYRLCVFPIEVPPLRERPEDIPILTRHLLAQISRQMGRPAPVITTAALAALAAHDFPGNVRELSNILERALVRCREPTLDLHHLSHVKGPGNANPREQTESELNVARQVQGVSDDEERWLPANLPIDLGQLERLAIQEALRRVDGNRTHAARLLGISLRTLRNKLRAWRQEKERMKLDPADATEARQPGEVSLAQGSQEPQGVVVKDSIPKSPTGRLQETGSEKADCREGVHAEHAA